MALLGATSALVACADTASTQTKTTGESSTVWSEKPIDDALSDDLNNQIRPNWDNASLSSDPACQNLAVMAHVALSANGTIIGIQIDNDHPEIPCFKHAADSVDRALLITHRLKLPGKTYPKITFRFRPTDFQ
jgi:hypothetical protein